MEGAAWAGTPRRTPRCTGAMGRCPSYQWLLAGPFEASGWLALLSQRGVTAKRRGATAVLGVIQALEGDLISILQLQ